MGLDFDALEYCKSVKLQQNGPPYACPVSACDRSYKTVAGLQYHLTNYDHDNPQPMTPVLVPNRKKARIRGVNHHSTPKESGKEGSSSKSAGEDKHGAGCSNQRQQQHYTNPESLVTYNEEQETVQFNLDGKSVRLGIDEPLPIIDDKEFTALVDRGCILNADAPPLEQNASWSRVQVPEARVRVIEDYNVPDAPQRPLAYYRFIEKSAEELDGEIEYDVDEEDSAWLEYMNEQREKAGHTPVTIDTMELLMDRLEKESFFQAAANGTPTGVEVDDDAVCCICLDGECQNTNVILFCDMCNLAVHQDCYGVPYIPEGQWLCRRCLQSPSKPVNCVLCPNAGGAFKQTDHGQWAHVVCALWIPEVRFANTVFLEPIDSIETIPAARWRLTCYVCKEKGLGACIQCHRNSCYAAFHVTCAQQAGLYMTMDTVKDGHNDSSMHVQKFAYCHAHTPPDAKLKLNQPDFEDTRHKMKEARKALAKKRSTAPVVLIPTIPPDRVQEICGMVHMQRKKEFIDRIIAYWTLKRHYRNGVPLLRRLQSQGQHNGVIQRKGIEGSPDTKELYKQLKYWQCLRQDLERARLLCELVRKREKLKAAYVKIYEQVVTLQLNPLESALSKMLDTLEGRDTSEIFREPVDTEEVPDYLDIVKQPMDLGTMRTKLSQGKYTTLEQMESDFDLMIQNCLAYNNKDTVFYRAGIRMRDQAAPLFVDLRKELRREGLLDSAEREHVDHVEREVEDELKQLLVMTASEAVVQKLLILADKSQVLKNPTYRTKKIKQIRMEISRMRKSLQKARLAARYSHANNSMQLQSEDEADDDADVRLTNKKVNKLYASAKRRVRKPLPANVMDVDDDDEDDDEEEEDEEEEEDDSMGEDTKGNAHIVQTPPCSPVKSLNNSTSPVGVNRRTTILLTRKAQAALKRPSEQMTTPVKEEHHQHHHHHHHHNSVATTQGVGIAGVANNITATGTNASSMNSNVVSLMSTATPTSPNFALAHNNNNAAHTAGAVAAATLASSAVNINSKLGLTALTSAGFPHSAAAATAKSPKRNARYKRLSDMRNSVSMSPKKSPNPATATTATPASAMLSANESLYERIPDSFKVYRANNERDVSDSDDGSNSSLTSSPCSSCSEFSGSGTASDFDSMDNDDDHSNNGNANDSEEADSDEQMETDSEDKDEQQPQHNKHPHTARQHEHPDDSQKSNAAYPAGLSLMNNTNDGNNGGGGEGDGATMSTSSSDSDSITDETDETEVQGKKRITRSTPIPQIEKQLKNSVAAATAKQRSNKKQQQRRNNIAAAMITSPTSTPTPPPMTSSLTTRKNATTNKQNQKLRAATPNASTSSTSSPFNVLMNNLRAKNRLNNINSNNANNNRTKSLMMMNSSHLITATVVADDSNHTQDDSNSMTTMAMTMMMDEVSSNSLHKPPLEPLQLVWAKCRGYPWYPALILDPKTPKGFVYNGVPLPAPPPDVLALRKNCTDNIVFLVLFFDAKRTWQWLPANKLEILGIDKQLDQQKLVESRKPAERKAVKRAYQDALLYQSQVSDLEGQGPDPIM